MCRQYMVWNKISLNGKKKKTYKQNEKKEEEEEWEIEYFRYYFQFLKSA